MCPSWTGSQLTQRGTRPAAETFGWKAESLVSYCRRNNTSVRDEHARDADVCWTVWLFSLMVYGEERGWKTDCCHCFRYWHTFVEVGQTPIHHRSSTSTLMMVKIKKSVRPAEGKMSLFIWNKTWLYQFKWSWQEWYTSLYLAHGLQ